MPRVKYENQAYLKAQRAAMQHAQYTLDRKPKEIREALGISYSMYRNYLFGIVPIPHDLLYLQRADNELAVQFVELFQRHLWGL